MNLLWKAVDSLIWFVGGIADEVMNAYYLGEATDHTYYQGAEFEKNKNEYVPVPIQQINYSKGSYEQNYGF